MGSVFFRGRGNSPKMYLESWLCARAWIDSAILSGDGMSSYWSKLTSTEYKEKVQIKQKYVLQRGFCFKLGS